MNKLAIILVNYNGINDTLECINSILNSEYSNIIVEIIVIDNCSTRDDLSMFNVYGNNVILIKNEINSGFSGANNIGIDYAIKNNFDYVLLLNNDTIIDKDMIDKLLSNSDTNTVTVPLMLYYNDRNRIWYAGGNISKWTGNNIHWYLNEILENVFLEDRYCSFATGCCIMLPVNVIKKIGKLEEDYFMYCEDTEYSIRMRINNIKILFVSDAKLWHKVSNSTGGTLSAFSIYYCTRNRFDYINKYKKYFKPTAFLFSLLSRCVRLIEYKLNGDVKWKAFYWGIKDYIKGKTGMNNYFN